MTTEETLRKIDATLRKNPLQETLLYLRDTGLYQGRERLSPIEAFFRTRAVITGNFERNGKLNPQLFNEALNLFFNLPDPFTKDRNLFAFLTRTAASQNLFANKPKYVIARSYCLYVDIMKGDNQYIEWIYKIETDLKVSVSDYLKLIFILYTFFDSYKNTQLFNCNLIYKYFCELKTQCELSSKSIELNTPISKNILQKLLDNLSIDHQGYRDKYKDINSTYEEDYVKSFFDPFKTYPLLKVKGDNFLPVDKELFLIRGSNLYWDFDRLESCNFRKKVFGNLFEEYVFKLLGNIYGTEIKLEHVKIHKNLNYRKNRSSAEFFDVILEFRDKVYLFEIKGFANPIENQVLGLQERRFKEFLEKPILQIKKRLDDKISGEFKELKVFENKKCIPIGILYDYPIQFKSLLNEKIRSEYPDFDCHLMSIQELEFFQDVKNKVSLDFLLEDLKNRSNQTLVQYLQEIKGELPIDSPFLNQYFNNALNLFVDT